jgi:hypothetical protein
LRKLASESDRRLFMSTRTADWRILQKYRLLREAAGTLGFLKPVST